MNSKVSRIGICGVVGVLGLLPFFTGCTGAPAWGGWSKRPTPAQIEAVMGRPLETFVYFSRYEIYQNERTREYIYQENNEWVHSAVPPSSIPEAKLQASPFVVLSLRDGPDKSYAKVGKQYSPDLEKSPTLMASVP